jgi:opacity protein-like surface antigen
MSKNVLFGAALAVGMAAVPGAANAEQVVKFFGGVSQPDDISGSYYGYDAELSTDSGYVVGAAFGATFSDFDVEAEVSFRQADLDEASFLGYTYDIEGDAEILAFMVNGWYNVPVSPNFALYGGGGVGWAQVESTFYYNEFDDAGFAFQLGVGADLRMNNGYSIGLGYRYFSVPDVGDAEVTTNDFMLVLSKRY